AVGSDGTRELPGLTQCNALVVDPNGNLIAVGTQDKDGYTAEVLATRLNPNGVVDTTYGSNGIATLSWSTRSIVLINRAVAIDPQGGLLVGLRTRDPGHRWMAATGR